MLLPVWPEGTAIPELESEMCQTRLMKTEEIDTSFRFTNDVEDYVTFTRITALRRVTKQEVLGLL